MDRARLPKKAKHHAPLPGDLVPLGPSKRPESETRKLPTPSSASSSSSSSSRPTVLTSTSSSSSSKSTGLSSSSSSSKSSSEKKRDSSHGSSSSSSSSKKIRLHAVGSSSSGQSSAHGSPVHKDVGSPYSPSVKMPSSPVPTKQPKLSREESYDISPQDLTADMFFSLMEKAEKAGNQNLQSLMLLALKRLNYTRDKPDLRLCSGLVSACQAHPHWFQSSSIVETIYSILSTKKLDMKSKFISASNPLQPFLICLLGTAYGNVPGWPTECFQLWVEDACGERAWVDKPHCKSFVENIVNSFGTSLPSAALLQPLVDLTPPVSGSSSPLGLLGDDSAGQMDEILQQFETIPIMNRSSGSLQLLENIVLEHAKEVILKRAPDIPKNVLKALSSACGLVGIRAFAILKLEIWIHHQKCSRQAQELLLHLCVNANAEIDNELVLSIAKLRLKTKPLIHFFAQAVKEMVRDNEANMRSVLNFVLNNELSAARNPSNLQILNAIMVGLESARPLLAELFVDLLIRREDQQQALRPVLKEIARQSRFEIELKSFAEGLTKFREVTWRDDGFKDRTFMAMADLIVACMFLSMTPAVKEAAVLKGDSKDLSIIHTFQANVSAIQETGICWLYTIVPRMFRPNKKEFGMALNKILLRDPIADIVSKDGWPPESERTLFARLCQDVQLKENVLMWTLLMGVSKDHPMNQPEILELVEFLIQRCASHKGLLQLEKPEPILQLFFRLCEYKHPENIALPVGYEPPKLAISKLYWKVWNILCIISAHNPGTFGKIGWDTYPTLRVIMEMCMTNHFTYPTVASSESAEEIHLKEMQISQLEKSEILQFEQHLAAATSKKIINEQNSLLLSQLIRMDPFGSPRTMPGSVLALLSGFNQEMHLGHHFCRSRNPDFLLDLIQRNSQPMPWLSELVAEGPIEILPVQCLCELMLGQIEKVTKALNNAGEVSTTEKTSKKIKASEDAKNLQLLQHLQKGINSPSTEDNNAKEILEYFLRRLSAPKKLSRMQALQGLQLLVSNSSKSLEENWLMDSFPTIPIFSELQPITTAFLRQAIQVENEPQWILRYLEFLSIWSPLEDDSSTDELALDVAQLVVERNGVVSALLSRFSKAYDALFDIFLNYMKKIREPHKETYKWSDSQELVLVQWPVDRLECTVNILVIHAIVILLSSYSISASSAKISEVKKLKTGRVKSAVDLKYNDLLDMWFPKGKDAAPKGYLLNTSEEAVLFPDWIKLRMIRSNNPRLVTCALQDLEADQLMLFVQSFGIPAQSMSALLFSLDAAVSSNPEKVTSSVTDPNYMNSLVELQWKRGADGGQKFARLLKRMAGIDEAMEVTKTPTTVKHVVRPKMPEMFTTASRIKLIRSKPGPVEVKVKVEPKEPFAKMGPSAEESEELIRNLSKELLAAVSLSPKRRSSAPVDDKSAGEIVQRRHSAFEDQGVVKGEVGRNLEGPLVDRIVELEPCVVKTALDSQIPLLFERTSNPLTSRPLLLNILAHQSSWKTVDFCINHFLSECDSRYDPTCVLDLIAATIKNPLVRPGSDKYVPKHQPERSPMKLTRAQILIMADYIIEEIACTVLKNTKFSITNLLGNSGKGGQSSGKPKQLLKERIRLWLICCEQDKDAVYSVIDQILSKRSNSPYAKKFLAQLYLEFPEAILADSWQDCDELVMADEDLSSALDTISLNLINAVGAVQPGKEWQKKAAQEMEVSLRKLASVHPTLMMRQVPLMGALLEGRVHLEFIVFHTQNHHVPFKVYLGLWEFMQPHILKYFKTMKSALSLYLKLFENYGHLKDYSLDVRRFCILMHNFWSKNPTEVEDFLRPYHSFLVDFATVKYYADVGPLHNLIQVLVSLQERKSGSTGHFGGVDGSGHDTSVVDPMGVFMDRFQHVNNVDECYPILQDLDNASSRNPSILEPFAEKLKSLMVCNNEMCRNLAYSMILKHITYSPRSRSVYFDAIVAGLCTEKLHVRETLLERIPEFIIMCQERADEILAKLFEIGVHSTLQTQGAISKTLGIFRSFNGT